MRGCQEIKTENYQKYFKFIKDLDFENYLFTVYFDFGKR
jgi:hypothetical protein